MQGNKVVHVFIKDCNVQPQDRYYGSLAAIYEDLTPEQIGIKLTSLMTALPKREIYENKLCRISVGTLQRKRTNRRPPSVSKDK